MSNNTYYIYAILNFLKYPTITCVCMKLKEIELALKVFRLFASIETIVKQIHSFFRDSRLCTIKSI